MEKTVNYERVGLYTNVSCNLKCRLCIAYSPYYPREACYSYECLKQTITEFFEVVDNVHKLTVAGGEPLLHPQLSEIIDYLTNYSDRIGVLEVITNGTIAINDKLLSILSSADKVKVLVDDYGPELSKKIPYIIDVFDNAGISYDIRKNYGFDAHCDGWADLTDLSDKHRNEEENSKVYHRCLYSNKLKCFPIMNGKAYVCATYKRCLDLGIIPDNSQEYIDFCDESISVIEKRQKMQNFYDRRCFSACAFCDGFFENSKRYPPAEQLGE